MDRDKIRAESKGVLELDAGNEVATNFIALLNALDVKDSALKVTSAISCQWYILAKRHAPKDEVEQAEKGIDDAVNWVKQMEAENKRLLNALDSAEKMLKDRTKDEIHALIEKYGDPQYKTNEFAIYDLIAVTQQLWGEIDLRRKERTALNAENTCLRKALEDTTKCNTKGCDGIINTSYCSKCLRDWES